ncbi:MAG: hypothetical protein HY423_15805, partial [Candidatus Lambdaproteobacteria bacterium]|nr:hypothetical protein [Candidatus Lambdaproteobacteria bacterium]
MKHLEAKQGFICNLAIGFFFLLILLSIQFHEMWRDELHTWAVALSSMSIEDIFRIRGSDGHPGLWYIVAYFLSRMTRHPLVFQLFHVAIATGSAAIFLKHAPFTVWKRLMFAFGYYSVFEYALITRAYGLGIALAFLSAAVMLSPRPRALLVGVALFFATQASAYSAILAGAIAPLMLVEFFRSLRKKETERYGWAIGLALVTVGIGLAAWQVLPPAGALASSLAARFTVSTAIQALSDFFSAFYPLPPFERAFWNQNVLASPGLKAILGGLVLLLTMALLARTPIVLSLSYVPGLVAMTAVNAYYEGYLRHHGHFFILFVCCLWLAEKYPKWHSGPWLLTEAWRLGDLLLYSALAIQMAAGFFALQQDWRLPFSGAEETAAVVHARGWDQGRLHGDIDFASSAVATYLDHDFHYPRTNATGKFVNWETRRLRPLAQPEMMVEMIADAES